MNGAARTFKVLSYNIHKGQGPVGSPFSLKKIKKTIEHLKFDLVFLQEVLGAHVKHKKHFPKTPDISQYEYLADKLWPHFLYGKNMIYSKGHHGNAILSRYPIIFSENVDISTHPLEKRGLLHAIIDVPELHAPVHIICIHFGLFDKSRLKQMRMLCHRIKSLIPKDEILIVAGDFNDWRERLSDDLKKEAHLDEIFLKMNGKHAKTFPVWVPVLPVDRIYFRGLVPMKATILCGDPWNKLSDHAAVSAEFRFHERS